MKLQQQTHDLYNQYLLDGIDFDGYDLPAPETNKEKINTFFDVFMSEVGYNIDRIGEYKALTEYLSGLPSVISIDFDNYSILERAVKYGSLSDNPTDKEKDTILDNYWAFMANKLIVLRNGHINRELLKTKLN